MSDAYVGQIILFGGNWAPENWALCDGKIMKIHDHPALYTILGIRFGGDGRETFGLPDLRSRVPVGIGQGEGLGAYAIGATGGVETVTLLADQMPSHTHAITAMNTLGTQADPTDAFLAQTADPSGMNPNTPSYVPSATTGKVPLNQGSVSTAGASAPHTNMPPYLALNYIICVNGLYPGRN
ncbi:MULTISPECIES: phage tail protein [Methylobacterium]|uniref:phage tail protein n=1 Tax=Methylobacterium TaxID=407 RepID=UPI0013ECD1D6|nr:tail fiber protein [Methylobacterium sp. DB0501]NGM36095.1 phage tail protein [Methylobacterium sp. DB0501]